MSLVPTLWVGTSLGSVLTVSITLPDGDARKTQAVLVSILGNYYHQKQRPLKVNKIKLI